MLKESADLSAMTALVDAYGTALEPFRSAKENMRAQIVDLESNADSLSVSFEVRTERRNTIDRLKKEIRDLEREWSPTLKRHQDLISELEAMVNRATAPNGESSSPEP